MNTQPTANGTASEKIMERVARLLALAEHENTPAPEAELALRQANSLITKHAIDEAILRQGQTATERRAIEKRTIDIGGGWTFGPTLQTIVYAAAEALRVSIVITGGKAICYGAAEDLAWLEMLYSTIRLQFLSKIDPKWDNAKSYDENVYTFKVAGNKWKEINAIAMRNGHESRESTEQIYIVDESSEWNNTEHWESKFEQLRGWEFGQDKDGRKTVRRPNGFFHKMKAAYVRHAKLIGDDTRVVTQSHEAYRLSFAEAFKMTMSDRFWRMQQDAASEMDSIPGAALALRDVKDEADRALWQDFPMLDPEEIAKRQEAQREQARKEALARQEMLDAMTPKERGAFLEKEEREQRRNQKRHAAWAKKNTYSWDRSAKERGTAAANAVDLTRKAGSAGAGANRGQIS